MKKLLGSLFALAMLFSVVFVAETVNASAQQTRVIVKRKRSGGVVGGTRYVYHKSANGVRYVSHKTKRGTKYVYHKSAQGTRYTAHKTKRGTKAVISRTKKIIIGQ